MFTKISARPRTSIALILSLLFLMTACAVPIPSTPVGSSSPAPNAVATVAPMPAPSTAPSVAESPVPSVSVVPTESPTASSTAIVYPSTFEPEIIFSLSHATYLFEGMPVDPKFVLKELACGLGAKRVTLVLNWNWVKDKSSQTFEAEYNIGSLLRILKGCGVTSVTIVIGRKSQHYPECHDDKEWMKALSEEEYKAEILKYEREVVTYLATEELVKEFQVENEPFLEFQFGNCRSLTNPEAFFAEEVATVRAADPLGRPISTTASGRTSDGRWGQWKKTASFVDKLLVSFYSIWYEYGAYVEYDNGTPADWTAFASSDGKNTQIGELQAEPPRDYKNLSYEESMKGMDLKRMTGNLKFVLDAGFTRVRFWGGEWWYFLKVKGHPELWDEAKKIFAQGKER